MNTQEVIDGIKSLTGKNLLVEWLPENSLTKLTIENTSIVFSVSDGNRFINTSVYYGYDLLQDTLIKIIEVFNLNYLPEHISITSVY